MSFSLRVYALGGEAVCDVIASSAWTVRDAKLAVEGATGTSLHQQRLLIGTVEPGDCERLGDYNDHISGVGGVASLDVLLIRRPPEQSEWLAKVDDDWHCLRKAPKHVQADSQIILRAVQIRGRALRYADSELRADPAVVRAAVLQDGEAIQYAAAEIRADCDMALLAVSRTPSALLRVAEALQNDREFLLAALQADTSGSAFKYLPAAIRADREMVLAAVRQNWRSLEHVPQGFLSDSEVVNAAVLQSLEALRYVSATVGLQQGMPPSMLELCRGQRSEFGAKVILQNELTPAMLEGVEQWSSRSGRSRGGQARLPSLGSRAGSSRGITPPGRLPSLGSRAGSSRCVTPSPRGRLPRGGLPLPPPPESTIRVFVDGGVRALSSRAVSCEPSPRCSPPSAHRFGLPSVASRTGSSRGLTPPGRLSLSRGGVAQPEGTLRVFVDGGVRLSSRAASCEAAPRCGPPATPPCLRMRTPPPPPLSGSSMPPRPPWPRG